MFLTLFLLFSTPEPLDEWHKKVINILGCSPWDIEGKLIASIPTPPGELEDVTLEYCIQSICIAKIIIALLENSKLGNIIKELNSMLKTNNGLLILEGIQVILLPLFTLKILQVLTDLGNLYQKNGETVEVFVSHFKLIFDCMEQFGYITISDLKVECSQWGFLHGAYGKHECLSWLQDEQIEEQGL